MSERASTRQDAPQRILVVDDHRAWVESIAERIRAEGFVVSTEHDGLAAVERLRRERPDVLVTDYFLGSLDGGKLCQVAKSVAGERAIRTIILTAGSDRSVNRVRAPHADAVIAKNRVDVVIADLREVLARCEPGTDRASDERRVVGSERLEPRALSSKVHSLKSYLDALHDCMGDAAIGVDARLRVYFLNASAAELLDSREADALAQPVGELLGVDDDHELLARLRASAAGEITRHRPLEVQLRGRFLRVTVAALDVDREHTGRRVLLLARDLSDLHAEETARQAAQARLYQTEKLAALGQLIAGVSHEINNPLAALGPNLGFLREEFEAVLRATAGITPPPKVLVTAREQVPALLDDCEHACERIASVVADMRLFSHTEPQRGTCLPLEEVVLSALSLAGNQIRAQARIERAVEPTPPIVLDRHALGQVFLNILINAAQAIESAADKGETGDKFVRVAARTEGEGVVVEITNNGPPIPKEVEARIFDPFFTTKPPGQGVGLGLAIAHEAVSRHGGYIETENTDEGVTFRVWLPADTGLALQDSGAPVDHPRSARVLIIDDEAIVRSSFRRALEAEHDVSVASDGQQALQRLLRDRSFDLVFCDLIMPRMSGMELYEQIKHHAPELARRFVFLTGGSNSPSARAFLERVDLPRAYKPISVADLRRLVSRCLASGGL